MAQRPADREPALARWIAASGVRQVACVGDSITHGTAGRPPLGTAVDRNWVEQLATALDEATGARPGDGFRGLWRSDEWTLDGAWARAEPDTAFDVAPFGKGYFSSGTTVDTLTWEKPAEMTVAACDIYWFHMPTTGNWQFRVDDGEWTNAGTTEVPDNRLHRIRVDHPVRARVEIRGSDGHAACVAPIAGINVYAAAPPATRGTIVHNLGHNYEALMWFCRPSSGDPLALLDDLRPNLITLLFSNDSQYNTEKAYADALHTLVARVRSYADVLVISPYEQGDRDTATQAKHRTIDKEAAAEMGCAHLDLYEAWAELAGAGWDAANECGLMHDRFHPSQLGHDDISARVQRALFVRDL